LSFAASIFVRSVSHTPHSTDFEPGCYCDCVCDTIWKSIVIQIKVFLHPDFYIIRASAYLKEKWWITTNKQKEGNAMLYCEFCAWMFVGYSKYDKQEYSIS